MPEHLDTTCGLPGAAVEVETYAELERARAIHRIRAALSDLPLRWLELRHLDEARRATSVPPPGWNSGQRSLMERLREVARRPVL